MRLPLSLPRSTVTNTIITHTPRYTGALHITLLTKGPHVLVGHNPSARRLLHRALERKGIAVAVGGEAAVVMRGGGEGGEGSLLCTDGRKFAFHEARGFRGFVGFGGGVSVLVGSVLRSSPSSCPLISPWTKQTVPLVHGGGAGAVAKGDG